MARYGLTLVLKKSVHSGQVSQLLFTIRLNVVKIPFPITKLDILYQLF